MNNFAFLSLMEVLASISVGIHAYSRNPRTRLNQVFFLFCANTSWSAFTEFVCLIADSGEIAQIWARIGLTWFIAPLLFYFILVFTHHEYWVAPTLRYLVLFSPPLLFSVIELIPGMTLLQAARIWWGWTPIYNDSPLNFIELSWGFLLTASAFYLAWRFSHRSSDALQKKQAIFIAYAILCQILLGFVTVLVLPALGLPFPELPNLWLLVGCLFIGYAIAKFHLFTLTPATAVESILSTMTEAFLLIDPRGKILGANPAATTLLGFEEGELSNQPVLNLFKDCSFDMPELVNGDFDVLLKPDRLRYLEVAVRSKNGTVIPLSVSKSMLVDAKGQLQGFIFILLDLTAIKRAELAKLEEREQVTREFVAKFSHELRTPLNAIIGFSEVLVDQTLGPLNPPQLDCAQEVRESGHYLLALVNEILDLTTLERGNMALPLEEFPLRALVEGLKPLVNQANRQKQHAIWYNVELGGDPSIFSCRLKLQQVLLNLLTNAVKFTPPGGNVTLIVRAVGKDGIYFAVEDTGIGISEEDQQKVFQKFFHPDLQAEGTGLGLALSKQVVARLGGNLQFESEPGKGSIFYFTLPREFKSLDKQ